jgi:hypothetical protein
MSERYKETVQFFNSQQQLMPGATVLVIGKRCSGKSWLLYDLMSQMSNWNFSYGLALSPTQSSRQAFARAIPELFIDKQSPQRLEHFVRTVNANYNRDVGRSRDPRRTFLFCDDCAFDNKFMRSKTISEVFLNGRQFATTCVLLLQYAFTVGPSIRMNSDFVFCFWDNSIKAQETYHSYFFNMMPKQTFKDVFSECTKDYGCLVMDVRKSATSRDWHDCVFWYKATAPDAIAPFQLCDRDFFRLTDYCRRAADETKAIADKTENDRVWRLGPDGKLFDVNKEDV